MGQIKATRSRQEMPEATYRCLKFGGVCFDAKPIEGFFALLQGVFDDSLYKV